MSNQISIADFAAVMSGPLTPGHWSAVQWACHAKTTIVADHEGVRTVVAECSGHGRHSTDSEADALLLAASKDLLDAAKKVVAALNNMPKSAFPLPADLQAAGDAAVEALRKAGELPS